MSTEFNPKLFRAQLQALLEHHQVGRMAHTREAIIADFLDHCLQAFARAGQDRVLMEAMTRTNTTAAPDPEQSWFDQLLNTAPPTEVEAPAPDAARPGPTVVKGGALKVFKLPAVADEATIQLLSIEVAAAPSPVMVQFMLDGEVQREWTLGNSIEIGDIKYKVIGILPDGTLILDRRPTTPLSDGGN